MRESPEVLTAYASRTQRVKVSGHILAYGTHLSYKLSYLVLFIRENAATIK